MEAKHTAPPYQVGNFDARKIFTCDENGPVEVARAKLTKDAAFIVRACNTHAELVDLLRDISGMLQAQDPMRERILTTLAKIEDKKGQKP